MNQPSIAVIEDEPSHATLLTYNLEQRGYSVSHFESGNSFLKDSSITKHRLIIINAQISDMNGFDLKNKIREKKLGSPILFLTTDNIEEFKWEAENIEFFGKPFKIASLMSKIDKLIKKPNLINKPFQSEHFDVIHCSCSSTMG